VLARRLEATAPGTRVEWFQSGSEKVAQRLDAELAAGGSPCDLLLTSDPAYYRRLDEEGRLVPYVSPAALRQPRRLVDPDGAFAAARLSTMVIGVSPKYAGPRPRAFADLASPGIRATLGDPLSSGTTLTAVGVLAARLGWDWFRALAAKGTVAAGGGGAVMQRLESGEADAGIVLLENVLLARARGSKVEAVIPSDGAIVIPGPIALLAHARRSEAARAVYDALLSPEVQRAIVALGKMHSPDPASPPPDGAPTLEALFDETEESSESIEKVKETFNAIFFKR
jgi:iron(III) transport system substrate-binding protein